MLKLVILVVAVSLLSRWAMGKWPWDLIKPPATRDRALSRARKVLGVPERASHAEIREAHRRLVARVHPDRGGSNAAVHEANDARDLLLNALPEESER